MKKNDIFKSPKLWGIVYFVTIILFAFPYYLFPQNLCTVNSEIKTFWDGIYFSIVTLTTLGFGDIYPITLCGKILVISEALIGIILIGLFLNAISHKQVELASNAEKEKINNEVLSNEKKKLIRYYKLLNLTEKKLILYAYQVSTPMGKRKIENMDLNFTFNDLKDLYVFSCLLTDDATKPVVHYYYLYLDEYISVLTKILLDVDINKFPHIETLIVNFLEINKSLDWRHSILSESLNKIDKNGKTLRQHLSQMIEKQKGEPEMLTSNAINQYIALYQSLKFNFAFFNHLKEEIDIYTSSEV